MTNLFSVFFPIIDPEGSKYFFDQGKYSKEISLQAFELAKLLLTMSQESVAALNGRRFSSFDALLRSGGCQITAVQVYSAVLKQDLFKEAKAMEVPLQDSKKRLLELEGQKADIKAFQDDPQLNLTISSLMCQMIRFYLLRKTRDIKNNFQCTEPKLLNGVTNLSMKVRKNLILKLQVEESKIAANFIAQKAQLEIQSPRCDVIVRQVSNTVFNCMEIMEVSTFYSLEACLRSFSGTVKVVDKDSLNFLFLKMPESELVKEDKLPASDTPVLVVEGYFQNQDLSPLVRKVQQGKALKYFLTAAALEIKENPKMGSCTEDMKALLKLPDQNDFSLRLKHFYTASIGEVL